MTKNQSISCIIPAYNEEKMIAKVIKPCLETDFLEEIIVINDGSIDKTLKIIAKFKNRIKIINLPENMGKGYAVAQGIKKAKGKIILMLDGDLINLQPHHLYALVAPLLQQNIDMAIGTFVDFKNPHYLNWPFSGQRAIQKKLLTPLLKRFEKTNYGLETILNEELKNKITVIVPLIALDYLKKPHKQQDWLASYLKMNWEITKETVKYKSKGQKEKIKNELAQKLAVYLKIENEKIKKYFTED